jgi:hypothetical protein
MTHEKRRQKSPAVVFKQGTNTETMEFKETNLADEAKCLHGGDVGHEARQVAAIARVTHNCTRLGGGGSQAHAAHFEKKVTWFGVYL